MVAVTNGALNTARSDLNLNSKADIKGFIGDFEEADFRLVNGSEVFRAANKPNMLTDSYVLDYSNEKEIYFSFFVNGSGTWVIKSLKTSWSEDLTHKPFSDVGLENVEVVNDDKEKMPDL